MITGVSRERLVEESPAVDPEALFLGGDKLGGDKRVFRYRLRDLPRLLAQYAATRCKVLLPPRSLPVHPLICRPAKVYPAGSMLLTDESPTNRPQSVRNRAN